MQAIDDLALLREYGANNSETAFEELVLRRVGFVYSAALRQVRDPHLADEITQVDFIILAKKAGKISDKTILTGWLFKTTRFVALAQIRANAKRSLRTATIEKEFQMQSEIQSAATDEIWNQMSPLLDEALASLGETDRQAVLLRFFENKSLVEVGSSLGTGEDTARKRVTRALEKLRKFFTKRGVSSTTAIIAGAISANSVQAAPVALAKSATAGAIVKGAAASGSTLTLIKGALKLMAWAKAKTAIVVGVGVLLAAGTTTVAIEKFTSPSIEDVFEHSSEGGYLKKAPPVVALQPGSGGEPSATSTDARMWLCRGWDWLCHDGHITNAGMRMIARSVPLGTLMSYAYGPPRFYIHWSENRVILAPDIADEKFDFLIAVPDHPQEALQAEIKKQLGLVAHREIREADVLVLKVSDSSAIRLTAAKAGNSSDSRGYGRFEFANEPVDDLSDFLENSLGKPVIDETRLTQKYSGSLKWNPQSDETAELKEIQNSLSDQLGLELVPSREPIEMLVVEKVK
jgi:uncharacterized protein (TIGR03435 family)